MNGEDVVRKAIEESGGVLRLRPAWVAHDFLEAGYRLGLSPEDYDAGERGTIMERWLCSETHATNRIDLAAEGFSELEIPGWQITVRDAVARCGPEILGEEYAMTHGSLGRLVKIYDFATRLFLHFHQRQEDLDSQGKTSKDEAYHYLDAPTGAHPETFFGVHPHIVERGLQDDIYLPIIESWSGGDSEVLRHSVAYLNVPGEGFLVHSGVLHAPGTALTLEIQEPSDVLAVLQPTVEGHPIRREMLLCDVAPEAVLALGARAVLRQIDWEANGDPRFYEHRHLFPKRVRETQQGERFEEWIYYGTSKFSGKRMVLRPGEEFWNVERGVHSIFVWRGEGMVAGLPVRAGDFDLHRCEDELLIVHDRAVSGYDIRNVGEEDLVLFKFFGPDINTAVAPPVGLPVQD